MIATTLVADPAQVMVELRLLEFLAGHHSLEGSTGGHSSCA